jgi:predicted N-acetyltransferase YhbS
MVRRELGIPDTALLLEMQVLAARHPDRSTHAVDLPYRLAWANPDRPWTVHTALWRDEDRLAAWAVWNPGSWVLEAAVEPALAERLWPELLAWGKQQLHEQAGGPAEPLRWHVTSRADDIERIALLEARGFRRQPWSLVHYERSLDGPIAATPPPPGFTIRPMAGEAEVPAYVASHRAAFNSTHMREEWRHRTLRAPGYRPDLDLVAVDSEGRVVGFAIVWLGPLVDGRCEGTFEPVGVHPEFHRRGLGRALLLEGMRRLKLAGATHALVATEDTRLPANALYSSVMEDSSVRTCYYTKEL